MMGVMSRATSLKIAELEKISKKVPTAKDRVVMVIAEPALSME